MKTKACFALVAAMLLVAAFAQSTGTTVKSKSEQQLALIQKYLNEIHQREALPNVGDNMPGAQPSLESKLVPLLAQELLTQQQEIQELNKQIGTLRGKTKKD